MAHIVVADSSAHTQRTLLACLEEDGHQVTAFALGQSLLEQVAGLRPDLILLNHNLTDMPGLDVCKQLKSDELLSSIPIIMMSSQDQEEAAVTALDLGADDHITIPTRYPILAARIRVALRMREQQETLAEANRALKTLAATDFLTGLLNRREFMTRSVIELARSWRYNTPLAIIMLDVDHFKQINDNFGHLAGDEALRRLADICRDEFRQVDVIGRLGGEEFAICLPNTALLGAEQVADRLRLRVAQLDRPYQGLPLKFTVSIGVAALDGNDRQITDILDRADKALYRAKQRGRNRVEIAVSAIESNNHY
ncbi:MAG TPA: diguanylate cyclase [Pseudomonadales bacterium]|nr:diguanylate cyclase [Pseudomonadales bacterium]